MTNEEWTAAIGMVTSAARTLQLLPLQQMLDDLGMMETVAPLLEPTAYAGGGATNLQDQRELLEAALRVQQAATNIAVRHGMRATT